MNPLFLALERASLFGLAVLLVALTAQWVLDGRVPASWRVWLWRVALGQTTLALVPLTPLRLAVLPPAPSVAAPLRPVVAAPRSAVSIENSASVRAAEVVAPPEPIAPLAAPVRAARPLGLWLLLTAYALGFGVQVVALARCFRRLRRRLRACEAVAAAEVEMELRRVAQAMQTPLPRLLKSEVGAPFLVGIWRPAIVLPRSLLSSRPADLTAVLLHELAHLKRRDLAWNALLWLVQSLLWFHPLVWIARRFLALETESACDEIVLSSTRIAPGSYGALLLNTMKTEPTPLTAGVADGFFALRTRLARLNRAPKRPRRAFQIAFAAALGLSLSAALPLRFVARAQDKAQATANPYLSDRGIPLDDTPETKVGLPATLDAARGNASISGRVVYENGKPAAGIRVFAFCRWLGQTELWGYKRNEANKYRWPAKIDHLLSGTAVTKADGTYRFTGLLPQRFRIHVRGDNYGNRAPAGFLAPYRGVSVVTVANRTQRAPDTVLRRSAVIRIRAVDQDSGVPLQGVMFRGFIINESSVRPTNLAVDAHRQMRPFKDFPSDGVTDRNGYCTLSLDAGEAYFYMTGGSGAVYVAGGQEDKMSQRKPGFPTHMITNPGLYRIETWCEVTSLVPATSSKPRRSWKGETEFPLKKGPAANFILRLKRDKPMTPQYRSMLKTIKQFNH